jgi:protein-S-isoprenylcysteine O-methyltransferase Ste14
MIEAYQIYLLLGLVLHKIVWEILRQRGTELPDKSPVKLPIKIRLIKQAKILVLIFLIIQTAFFPNLIPITENPEVIRWIGLVVYTSGLLLAILGRVQLGGNWANIEDYRVLKNQQLVHNGVYKYIRHPIYAGDMLLIMGLELALNSWLVLGVIALVIYVTRQAKKEEVILKKAFTDYGNYQKTTKMFVPYIF